MSTNIELIKKLRKDTILESHELKQLLTTLTKEDEEFLYSQAREVKKEVYGDEVYIRGLIEFTNYCKKDCVYCGIRASNRNADRYRLSFDEIMECTDLGYGLGFRTFVLQGEKILLLMIICVRLSVQLSSVMLTVQLLFP